MAAGLFFAVYLGWLVRSSGGNVITFFAAQRLTYRLRVRLLDHLEALSCGFYADAADADRVPLLPLFVFVRHRYRMILRRVSDDVREAMGRQSRVLNEILTGVTQIQLLGAERRVSRRYARLNRVAIVGASGCGTSSRLKLMPRVYDVKEGSVTIDTMDVRRGQLRSLRRAISVVPQEPVLLQGTLRDNLRHARRTASRADLARVAQAACRMEVVDRLPGGWDAPLGPMGAGLSGGEKQRVGIARALLHDRPIMILDEATSALDPPTEQRLLAHLDAWCTGRIVVVVTHRLSAACWADRIIVLSRGQLVEQGNHDTLFRPGTRYHKLWQRQSDDDGLSAAASRAGTRLEPTSAR